MLEMTPTETADMTERYNGRRATGEVGNPSPNIHTKVQDTFRDIPCRHLDDESLCGSPYTL